jgi:hypothetical protein
MYLTFSDVEELRTRRWGNGAPGDDGLLRQLSTVPGLGPKGIAQVEAWRNGRHPSSAVAPGPVRVSVPLEPDTVTALDAWIAQQPTPVTRAEAIRAMVTASLVIMGTPEISEP